MSMTPVCEPRYTTACQQVPEHHRRMFIISVRLLKHAKNMKRNTNFFENKVFKGKESRVFLFRLLAPLCAVQPWIGQELRPRKLVWVLHSGCHSLFCRGDFAKWKKKLKNRTPEKLTLISRKRCYKELLWTFRIMGKCSSLCLMQ